HYLLFLLFRSMVGIGEASYSTIAPTIISDLFVKDLRSQMLAFFYFAIPIGSGLGYIVGSTAFSVMGAWPWSLRVTPVLGACAVLLILFFMEDPERGEAEGRVTEERTSFGEDIRALCKKCKGNWPKRWVKLLRNARTPESNPLKLVLTANECKFLIFLNLNWSIVADMTLYVVLPLRRSTAEAFQILISHAFGDAGSPYLIGLISKLFLNLNWSIVADMTLYVVLPLRRSTAEAFQILISHAFGDAGSPYLIGLLSEMFRHSLQLGASTLVANAMLPSSLAPSLPFSSSNSTSLPLVSSLDETAHRSDEFLAHKSDEFLAHKSDEFLALQYALFITSFIEVLGGIFFLLGSLYIVQDRARANREIAGEDNPASNEDR
ncbi:protein spinster-like, partial [Diaphorina citri]|uniref:Protein spinster-like n=1 Tax=Diaphorina citri TaxID=121845 RepID=A0A1S3DCD7_DIACI